MSDSFLELKNLKKSFTPEEYVLQGINLKIEQGEFVTLLGASGCGKTTTLRIIAGLEQPDSGSVWLEGKDVTLLEPNKRDVNTVFQNYALFPHRNQASICKLSFDFSSTVLIRTEKLFSLLYQLSPVFVNRSPHWFTRKQL